MIHGKGCRVRVLVVDDSAFVRRSLLKIFECDPEITVVGAAWDGDMALSLVAALKPDVITLDVQMPGMDGLTVLDRIMREHPTPVIMLSNNTGRGGETTIRALELGAFDFVEKCSAGGALQIAPLAQELREKIKVAASLRIAGTAPPPHISAAPGTPRSGGEGVELVLIGTSTGGPAALTATLSGLPADFPVPIVVVQHMPAGFTGRLAERLNRSSALLVKEAEEGERLLAGCAYVAPGGTHLKVRRGGSDLFACLDADPRDVPHRPSVDVLFRSAAAVCGGGCLAFVLTGMGSDGAAGALDIKERGGAVFVEAAETCVVPGMPGATSAAVQVDGVLPLTEMAHTMLRLVSRPLPG